MDISEIGQSVGYDHVTDTILAGTQDNGVIRQTAGNSREWDTVVGGDGNFVGVGYLADDPNHAIEYYLANIPNNVTVTENADGTTGKIVLGDPTDPAKPFRRSLELRLPIHETLLGGSLTLDGNIELLVEVDVVLEVGVDSSGFYIRTDALARIRFLQSFTTLRQRKSEF